MPDVNVLGLLDGQGDGFNPAEWEQITKPNKRTDLQLLGKLFFYDMQVGSDGVQACASCHFNSGADIRTVNSMSPGLKRGDTSHQLLGVNKKLDVMDYGGLSSPRGLPVSESALIGAGATPDQEDGTPGNLVDSALLGSIAGQDVNDVVSSQGVRATDFTGLIPGSIQDAGILRVNDDGFDDSDDLFDGFPNNAAGIPDTVRRVEPRNTPTTYNAIFNQSSFWDGRADMFFNGVNTLGFRDPDATLRVYSGGNYAQEHSVLIPFSSLASQAVGPTGSDFEMEFIHRGGGGGNGYNLGRKMVNLTPLYGQWVNCNDSLLGSVAGCDPAEEQVRGINGYLYSDFIKDIFLEKFWGDGSGNDVCLTKASNFTQKVDISNCGYSSENRTLMEVNFNLFWGLAVQAYEATLTTGNTIVDLMAGGMIDSDPDGNNGPKTIIEHISSDGRTMVRLDVGKSRPPAGTPSRSFQMINGRFMIVMDWTGLQPDGDGVSFEDCSIMLPPSSTEVEATAAYDSCALKFAEFIHPKAETGSEAPNAPNQPESGTLLAGEPIGGCAPPYDSRVCEAAAATIANIDEGMGRFQAGATDCAECHASAEFTGATISGTTGFGVEPLPPGEEPPAILERMNTFENQGVYDAGFYNIAIRPTGEDLSVGDNITTTNGGVIPLSKAKLAQLMGMLPGDLPAPYDSPETKAVLQKIADSLQAGVGVGGVQIPTAPGDLTAKPFAMNLACDPDMGAVVCDPTVPSDDLVLRNGFFKTPTIRMTKFTGPFMHNGSKMNLRQVLEFYKTVVDFDLSDDKRFGVANLNLHNLDAGLRIVDVGADREAAMVEMMETGLTDWGAAYQEGKFDHPQICVPNGHDGKGRTKLANIAAVGTDGNTTRIITFQEMLEEVTGFANDLTEPCDMDIANPNGKSKIEVPYAAP
ncbi:cytochrome c peroxidase [Microbulbifer agarilyticus]